MTPRDDRVTQFYDDRTPNYGSAPGADNAHARIPSLVGRGKRVLDVGCGRGLLGAEIKAAGNTVVGIELAPTAVSEARERLDDVVAGSIDDPELELPAGPFDVIVCADILEHLFDPAAVLARLRPLLARDGVLIASLPNVAHFTLRLGLLRGRWEYQEVGLLDRGHIRFFTRITAIALLESASFEVVGEDSALSIPFATRSARRVIDLCRRLPARWRRRLAPLIAAQFIFVARRR